ncbi:hypothetical protein EVAR_44782_1 [Eumeta japonica]|uniref:Uncharacterized protein n=1 Tax=Eumeta variegata TaxID=151549 RepID=A0A4C1Y913_EUMVA|nr:hypothetical protein EVAR_44782_1 [Eumeta japonica]
MQYHTLAYTLFGSFFSEDTGAHRKAPVRRGRYCNTHLLSIFGYLGTPILTGSEPRRRRSSINKRHTQSELRVTINSCPRQPIQSSGRRRRPINLY